MIEVSNRKANSKDNQAVQDVDICSVLDTYMYLDFKFAKDNMTIREIKDYMKNNYPELAKEKKAELAIIDDAIFINPQIGDMKISNQSCKIGGFNAGTHAASFTDANGNVYVAFRGTGDGEWLDNGLGMTEVSTPQQREALKYFDTICKKNEWTAENNIIITGHSKGGNKAQFVTLNSKYGAYVDKCYSIDGQGFSPVAVEMMKDKYGERAYNEAIDKIYSINGENDFVHVLGQIVIKGENTFYRKTPVGNRFDKLHDIVGMFACGENEEGELIFDGTLNAPSKQELISKNAQNLSEVLLRLPHDQRHDVAMVIMQIMENIKGSKDSLIGEKLTLENITGFVADGVPAILFTLLSTPEGRELIMQTGSQLFNSFYEKYGPWGVAGLVVAAFVFLPQIAQVSIVVTGTAKCIYEIARVINSIYDAVREIKEFSQSAYNFIVDCGENLRELLNSLSDWYDKNFNTGYKYAIENPYIRLNTYKLHDYASKLEGINRRLSYLDSRLDSLYDDIISDLDISDLWNIFKSDFLTGYSYKLKGCINYLKDTAEDFEEAERKIQSKLTELNF